MDTPWLLIDQKKNKLLYVLPKNKVFCVAYLYFSFLKQNQSKHHLTFSRVVGQHTTFWTPGLQTRKSVLLCSHIRGCEYLV